MINRRFATVVEIIGILAILGGVSLELYYKAEVYLAVITIGSAVFAMGSLVFAKVVRDG